MWEEFYRWGKLRHMEVELAKGTQQSVQCKSWPWVYGWVGEQPESRAGSPPGSLPGSWQQTQSRAPVEVGGGTELRGPAAGWGLSDQESPACLVFWPWGPRSSQCSPRKSGLPCKARSEAGSAWVSPGRGAEVSVLLVDVRNRTWPSGAHA